MGKAKIRPSIKSKKSERVSTKFGAVDYVPEICPQTKFGYDRIRGGFWVYV